MMKISKLIIAMAAPLAISLVSCSPKSHLTEQFPMKWGDLRFEGSNSEELLTESVYAHAQKSGWVNPTRKEGCLKDQIYAELRKYGDKHFDWGEIPGAYFLDVARYADKNSDGKVTVKEAERAYDHFLEE